MTLQYDEVLARLESLASADYLAEMSRVGNEARRAYGIRVPDLRSLAKKTGRDHQLAQRLWTSGIHEAQVVATMIDDPNQVTEEQMERWALDLDSCGICDGWGGALFDKTPFAYQKAHEWSSRPEEFVKRAAFSLIANLAIHDKQALDGKFIAFLPVIEQESTDRRNFVKKAVNWALRNIGKRTVFLNAVAIETARNIHGSHERTARWIASDALRELTGEKVQARLHR